MILKGNKAIDYLANEAVKDDPGASSHWRYYHSKFSFNQGKMEGIQGFGGNGVPYSGLRKIAHQFLQKPYRNMASDFYSFNQIDKSANIITSKQNRAYDLDVLRQSITLGFLKNHCPNQLNGEKTVWVIGDGFASMTSLLLANKFTKRVVLVNLTKTLLVDLYYLRLWLGEKKFDKVVSLYSGEIGVQDITKEENTEEFEVIALQATNYKLLENFETDLVINIASMQEMNPEYIANYFKEIRNASKTNEVIFYCCNRV
jgi:putative sugar O-methyltransferase